MWDVGEGGLGRFHYSNYNLKNLIQINLDMHNFQNEAVLYSNFTLNCLFMNSVNLAF